MPDFSDMNVYWLEQQESEIHVENDWMSVIERAHLDSIRFQKRRLDWRLGRWTAKKAIATYLCVQPTSATLSNIIIPAQSSGAPKVFFGNKPANIEISISHSSGTAACVIGESSSRIGCDLEKIESRSDGFVSDYFTEEEQRFLEGFSSFERTQLINVIWCAKESALKALHKGLMLDTRTINVHVNYCQRSSEHSWCGLRVHSETGHIFEGWFQCCDGFARALVGIPQPQSLVQLKGL